MKVIEKDRIKQAFEKEIDYDELLKCTRCGFCLPSCPTYLETNFDETQSPRGRIALMKAVIDGQIEPSEEVKRSIDLCLGCRACETACPSGVRFGRLLEQAREAIYQNNNQNLVQKFTRKMTFDQLFPYQNRIKNAVSLLGFYQRSGLQNTTRKLGIMRLFPKHLQSMEKVLPKVPKRRLMKKSQQDYQPLSKQKAKVAFFTGCLMDSMFKGTNEATIKLLQIAGCEVIIPDNQGCCGALHGHSGEQEKARSLAKRNIDAFEKMGIEYIITNAGGCGGFLNDYSYLLKDDPEWSARAIAFEEKITDITSILVDLGFHRLPLSLENQVITYQDSCHLKNGQGTFKEPRLLIESIKNINFVDMKDADSCCGSAGIYNIIESKMSMQILDTKMKNVKSIQAKTIVTANPGCFLQMKLGIEREGLSDRMRAIHIVDLLLEAYEHAKDYSS